MKDDVYFMRQALAEAKKSAVEGEIPIGAVVVAGNRILSRAHNQTIGESDPSAHAEIRAIRKACQKRGNHRIPDCDLYVTLEPCPMCLGAVVQARVGRLIYGATDPKGGAVLSVMRFPFRKLNHRPGVNAGLLNEECSKILKEFFKKRRRPKALSE